MLALFFQLVRFAGIGFLNTSLTFAVLNFFMALTGMFKGTAVGVFSVIAFCVAVLHSYFWNKYWAFNNGGGTEKLFENIWQFVVAAVLGMAVLVAVVYGSRKGYPFSFYILLIAVLAGGEILMWKFYHLSRNLLSAVKQTNREFIYFIVISVVGALINYLVLKYGTVYIPPKFGLNPQLWANIIQALATAVSLVWNFAGYKILVFKK